MLNRVCYDAKMASTVGGGPVPSPAASPSPQPNGSPPTSPSAEAEEKFPQSMAAKSLGLTGEDALLERNPQGYMIISQSDILEHVFVPLHQEGCSIDVLVPCLVEYMRSIYRHFLPTSPALNDMMVQLLVKGQRYFEFHQFLQYHILNDSLTIAERLLELSAEYPPAGQLGLDMLFRLNSTTRLLLVLLERREVVSALRLIPPRSPLFEKEQLMPRDFLAAARDTGDALVFYSAFKFFESRNLTRRNSPLFTPEEKCDEFVAHYLALFGKPTSGPIFGSFGWFQEDEDEDEEELSLVHAAEAEVARERPE
jgi:hypothetical protein